MTLICRECNGTTVRKMGWIWRRVDGVRTHLQQYQCNQCGKLFTTQNNTPPKTEVKILQVTPTTFKRLWQRKQTNQTIDALLQELLDMTDAHIVTTLKEKPPESDNNSQPNETLVLRESATTQPSIDEVAEEGEWLQ